MRVWYGGVVSNTEIHTWKTFHKFSKTMIRSVFSIKILFDKASTLHSMKSGTEYERNADRSVFNKTSVKILYHFSVR